MISFETDVLEAIAVGTGCALVIVDGDGLIEYWGPQLEGLCGVAASQVVGQPWSELFLPCGFADSEGGEDDVAFGLVEAATALPGLVFYPVTDNSNKVGRRVGVLRFDSLCKDENDDDGSSFEQDNFVGIPDSKALFELLQRQIAYRGRYQTSFTLLFLRLKNHRTLVDVLGAENLELTNRAVCDQLRAIVRMADSVGLYDESTFWMVLANSDCEGALVVAEKVKHLTSSMKVDVVDLTLEVAVGGVVARVGEKRNELVARGLSEVEKALGLPTGISVEV